jgi:phage I-like protein
MTRTRRIIAKTSPASRRVRMRAFAFEQRVPPAEIQLWDVGANGTDFGTHIWNERSVAEVTSRYNERGNPLLVDVEHNGAKLDDDVPAATAGYASLEIRDGAPWLVFNWSAYGVEQIATGQRRFLSPEYDIDADTNEIVRLYRVSLVAEPGTYRARVLASAADDQEKNMDPTLAAIMGILNSVTDPAAAIEAIKGFVANLPSSEDVVDPATDDTITEPTFAAAPAAKPIAASADPKPTPIEPPASAAVSPVVTPITASVEDAGAVKAAREYAQQSENALRDSILLRDGHRLAPSIRQWASAQPLNVVRGLCSAAPEVTAPPARVTATRGDTQGTGIVHKGLEGRELEAMQRAMGTYRASMPTAPYTNERGEWVLPSLTPTEHRRIQAAAAAKEGK